MTPAIRATRDEKGAGLLFLSTRRKRSPAPFPFPASIGPRALGAITANDILTYVASSYQLPAASFERPTANRAQTHAVLNRWQLADVSRLSRDPRAERTRRPFHQRRVRVRDDAAQAAERSQAAVHRGRLRPSRPDVSLRACRRLQGQSRADAVRFGRADSARACGVRGARRTGAHLRRVCS